MKIKLLAVSLVLLMFITCSKDSYHTAPTLEFESVNGSVFPQQTNINFKLQVTDKEGDVVDTIWVQRVSKVAACKYLSLTDSFPIPDFKPSRNVKAEFDFNYGYATVLPPNLQGCTFNMSESVTDTSYFRFWMHDEKQHVSDTVQSPDIVLLKQ